jgi:catechol 2,3-dioxygenase-like lactoylglutathione lyase family enzyme
VSKPTNTEFDIRGVNHLALVSSDMARTVAFYRDVLGMPLIKTLDLPGGSGQHFFFDIGNGDSIAFFWFPDAPVAHPGIASPTGLPGGGKGSSASAHGSMHHIAFNVPVDKFEEYCERLKAKGVAVSDIFNHDSSDDQCSDTVTDDVYVRSAYFYDPDGALLEFACWTKTFDERDVAHDPVGADGRKVLGLIGTPA